jgi:hypothetical protein
MGATFVVHHADHWPKIVNATVMRGNAVARFLARTRLAIQ